MEAFDRLLIPFLIKTLTNNQDDKVRTSKRFMFGRSESATNQHKHHRGTTCNKNGAFYPR